VGIWFLAAYGHLCEIVWPRMITWQKKGNPKRLCAEGNACCRSHTMLIEEVFDRIDSCTKLWLSLISNPVLTI